MAVLIGVDLGTTKITAVALDAESGELLGVHGEANTANITSAEDKARDRSEWDAAAIVKIGVQCLRRLAESLGDRRGDVAAIGVTGQQHGVVLVDEHASPVTPLINWQDRRALEPVEAGQLGTWLDLAREHVGADASLRTGCRLQPGFMGVTLFRLARQGQLPAAGKAAVFIMDLFAAALAGTRPVSEPTCAASSGLFNFRLRQWDNESIRSLGLAHSMFPEIVEADRPMGRLSAVLADATGLPEGTPIVGPLGDHQASFVGSVDRPLSTGLVNVGTGAQAAVFVETGEFHPPVEVRPYPIRGNLLSNVGLAGGWAYQTLERFFRDVGEAFFPGQVPESLYSRMNELAAQVPAGANGVTSVPTFSGTRSDPTLRGSFTGLSPNSFRVAEMCRAVIEGMAQSLTDGLHTSEMQAGRKVQGLAAAGNGLRENPLLAAEVERKTGRPIRYTRHREEAAFGSALVAGVGAGVYSDLASAGTRVRYEEPRQ